MMILLAVISLFLAILFGMTGMGGGVAYTPLQLLFGIDFQTAATTSLFLISVTSISAALVYIKQKRVAWKLVFWLELFTASGSFVGGYFSHYFPESLLKILFALFLLLSGLTVLLKKEQKKVHLEKKSWYHITIRDGENTIPLNMLLAAPASLMAGLSAGLLGVGGGLFKLPLMISLLGIPMPIAIANSAVMVGITGGSGFVGRVITQGFDWKIGLLMGGAIFIGARIGAHFGSKVDQKSLKKIVGIALMVIGLVLLGIIVSSHFS